MTWNTEDDDPFAADRAEIRREFHEWWRFGRSGTRRRKHEPCGNCGRVRELVKERCGACRMHLLRRGVERPARKARAA